MNSSVAEASTCTMKYFNEASVLYIFLTLDIDIYMCTHNDGRSWNSVASSVTRLWSGRQESGMIPYKGKRHFLSSKFRLSLGPTQRATH
jgi:hypothetical protein